jgi:hypothetical protein
MILHRDETTPHLTAFVVPVHPETGKLNASHWLDGREKLQDLQDSYAEAVATHGLERGIAGSKAKHTTVKQFYGAMHSDVGGIDVPEISLPPAIIGREAWRQEETKRIDGVIRPQALKLKRQARAGIEATKKAKENQQTAESLRGISDNVRSLPMTEVLERLGLKPDPADKKQWIDAEKRFRISIKDAKFFDHTAGKGGGGAIDLAMHVLGRDYRGTVSWLASAMGVSQTVKGVASDALSKSQSVVAEAQKEPAFIARSVEVDPKLIEDYLVTRRGLPSRVLKLNSIVTDERKNIGFVMKDENGQVRGLELKGTGKTPFTGLALGSSREAVFRIGAKGTTESGYDLVVTESAIDALSYLYTSSRDQHQNGLYIISTSGARRRLPQGAARIAANAASILVGFDNDTAGDKAAVSMMEALRTWFKGTVKRVRSKGKDWNEQLMAEVGLIQLPDPAPRPEPLKRPIQRGRNQGGMEM